MRKDNSVARMPRCFFYKNRTAFTIMCTVYSKKRTVHTINHTAFTNNRTVHTINRTAFTISYIKT